MELCNGLRCKHAITKGLLTEIRKQKGYGLIFQYFLRFCCKHDITKGLFAQIENKGLSFRFRVFFRGAEVTVLIVRQKVEMIGKVCLAEGTDNAEDM
jgi:hypothetical protein